MEFRHAVQYVLEHDAFEDQDAYLAHGFLSGNDLSDAEWQIGFYHPADDTIVSYHVAGKGLTRAPPAEVFKEGDSVSRLELDDVRIPHGEAVNIALDQLSAKHPQHPHMKTILLLQHDGVRAIYNISLVTHTLQLYNVKVDAATGNIVSAELSSLLDLAQEE